MRVLCKQFYTLSQIFCLYFFSMSTFNLVMPAKHMTYTGITGLHYGTFGGCRLCFPTGRITPFNCYYRQFISFIQYINSIIPFLYARSLPGTKVLIIAYESKLMSFPIYHVRKFQPLAPYPGQVYSTQCIRISRYNPLTRPKSGFCDYIQPVSLIKMVKFIPNTP